MKEFSRYEDTTLIVMQGIYETDTLANLLERDDSDIVQRYFELNITDVWSAIDDEILKEHYANADPDTLCYLFRKTPKQLKGRAKHYKLVRSIPKEGDLELWVNGELHETYPVFRFSKSNYRYLNFYRFAERVRNSFHVVIRLVGEHKELELYNSANDDNISLPSQLNT